MRRTLELILYNINETVYRNYLTYNKYSFNNKSEILNLKHSKISKRFHYIYGNLKILDVRRWMYDIVRRTMYVNDSNCRTFQLVPFKIVRLRKSTTIFI